MAALAACGGGAGRPAAFPDPPGPLDVHTQLISHSSAVRIELVTFRGAGSRVVEGFLAVSRRPGRHPAALFLHGAGGSMNDFFVSAALFANAGGVGLSIQQPNDATTWAPLVENARRALDVLQAQPNVDPNRLGVVGMSLGAETAAIVAGVDPRPRVFGLMSCRGGPVVTRYLRYARGDFYLQNGLHDEVVPRAQLRRTIAAIHGHRRVSWYDTQHVLDRAAFWQQFVWLRAELHPSSD